MTYELVQIKYNNSSNIINNKINKKSNKSYNSSNKSNININNSNMSNSNNKIWMKITRTTILMIRISNNKTIKSYQKVMFNPCIMIMIV